MINMNTYSSYCCASALLNVCSIPLQDPMNGQVFMQGNSTLFDCFAGTTVMGIPF